MAAMRPSAGPAKDCEITCLACGGPLPSREGQFVLKYFLGLRGIEWAILSSMVKKAVYCLGILHYRWAWNLASMMDDTSSEAEPAALGYVFVPWFSTGTDRSRDFR